MVLHKVLLDVSDQPVWERCQPYTAVLAAQKLGLLIRTTSISVACRRAFLAARGLSIARRRIMRPTCIVCQQMISTRRLRVITINTNTNYKVLRAPSVQVITSRWPQQKAAKITQLTAVLLDHLKRRNIQVTFLLSFSFLILECKGHVISYF